MESHVRSVGEVNDLSHDHLRYKKPRISRSAPSKKLFLIDDGLYLLIQI
jgi:hypothetical protein